MLRKIPFDTAEPVLERFNPSQEASETIDVNDPPDAVLAALYKGNHMVDMVNFFAHGLPPREGVCWAIAVTRALRKAPDVAEADLLALCAKWVKDPQEGTRILVMQEGERRSSEDPLCWLCNAVAWNGSGSMGVADGPVVLPPAGLHAKALLGAVALLAGDTEEGFLAVHENAYHWGLTVAQGGWPLEPT